MSTAKIVKPRLLMLSLSLVFLALLGMRLYKFGVIPNGVNRDEASIGYTAYLLLHTGMDEHSQKWPIRFESFGDWKRPLYIYLSIPFIRIFGLSPVSVRLPNLIAGIVMLYVAYKVEAKYFAGAKRGFWGSLMLIVFLGLNPWHFHFSRFAVEPLMAAAFFTCSLWFLLRDATIKALSTGIFFLLCAFFSYHAALVFIPLWFTSYLWLYKEGLLKKPLVLVPIITFYSIVGFVFLQAWISGERAKATGTTIFTLSPDEQWQKIYQYRNEGVWSTLIHNQYSYYLQTFLGNYSRSFTPEFLWLKGGNHVHYNIPGFGNFYFIEVVLAALGCYAIIRKGNKTGYALLMAILLAPIPGALTKDGIHSTREIFFLPTLQIVAVYGFAYIFRHIREKRIRHAFTGLILMLLGVQAIPFFTTYFGTYESASNARFSGYMKQVSEDLIEFEAKYPRIYVTYPFESPYIFYAFYTRMDPKIFLRNILHAPLDSLGFKHAQTQGKIHYIKDKDELLKLTDKDLEGSIVLSRVDEIRGAQAQKVYYDALGMAQIEVIRGEELVVLKP